MRGLRPALLSATALLVLTSADLAAQPPALTLPWTEQPPEPGDFAHLYKAMRPRADFRYEHKFIDVLGCKMAYVDKGQGDPIVFLHGAPESAYVWRNVMPYLEAYGRIIAPELPGHGKSGKPDIDYTFSDYRKYVDGFMTKMGLTNVTFVIHDWGSVLGLDWAANNPDKVRGIAMMEALCAPFYPILSSKEALKRKGKAGAVHHYQLYKSDAAHDLAIKQNLFIEQVMQLHTFRELSQREMDAYREPFRKEEDRKPLFMWAREVGLDGDRPIADAAMKKYNKWLLETNIPVLDVYGFPGEVSEEYDVLWRTERLKNHETAFVGPCLHFIQEDQPDATGRAIAEWYRRNLAPNRNKWFTNASPEGPVPMEASHRRGK